jgi:PAS domain S-box-containing protein
MQTESGRSHWEVLPAMSLRSKLLLPALGVSLVLFAYMAWGWLPGSLATANRVVMAGASLGAALAVLSVIAFGLERRVARPLAALIRSAEAGASAGIDEIDGIARTIAALERTARTQQADLEQAIQRRKQIEAALQLSEERYALAIRSSSDGLWEWSLDSDDMHLSPRWKGMLGYADQELRGGRERWRRCVHPDDLAQVEGALRAHLEGERDIYEMQHRLLHKDGSVRWILSRGTAIRHASGKPYRMVGLDTDVTRIKRIETILNEIVAGTSGQFGDAFFHSLVRHFAAALQVPCAFITECADQPPSRLRTLAFWSEADFLDNFEYDLPGTPCESVVKEGRTCFHPKGLAALFPIEEGYESYLGIPIFGSDGKVIGHLAFLDTKEMTEDMLVDAIHRIFTARAGAEIERMAALELLSRSAAPLRDPVPR